MKILLSSIAKNDIKLLMRVFNAERENKGIEFLDDLKESITKIQEHSQTHLIREKQITVDKMQNFPVRIHYIFENEDNLLVTAIFKED
ncbi:hypothetical protein [Chryseobacterium sp. SIMBA_029]|uniref:hypothetical protein n=1 Tax=Chryseobacterium sp. SIMBA_029 TaxID=3085772 RepID=UPI00397A8A4B